MKIRFAIALVLALALAVAAPRVVAQVPTAPQSAPIYGFLDSPPIDAVVGSSVEFAGWSLNCNTGEQPLSIALWRFNVATGELVQVPTMRQPQRRPDVRSVYAPYCSCLVEQTGWRLTPVSAQPPGVYDYQIILADAPYSQAVGSLTVRVTVQ